MSLRKELDTGFRVPSITIDEYNLDSKDSVACNIIYSKDDPSIALNYKVVNDGNGILVYNSN